MDVMALAGMVFVLIILVIIGGFILLLPLTRRLGEVLEQRLQKAGGESAGAADLRQLEATVRGMQEELARLAERQSFMDSLLTQREQSSLPGPTESSRTGQTAGAGE